MNTGCASINCDEMVAGAAYTFRFKFGGILGLSPSAQAISDAVSNDSNFQSPTASIVHNGIFARDEVLVSFAYAGGGSLVGQAGQEMQNVINNFWTMGVGSSLIFESAQGGVCTTPDCSCCAGSSSVLWLVAIALVGYLAVQMVGLQTIKGWLKR